MRFGIFIILIIFLLSFAFVQIKFSKPANDNIISNQKNYVVFYNKVNNENIKTISKYDMAIIEPTNITSEQLNILKESNTISFAYQSIFEVEPYHKKKVSLLKEEDYLYINGVKQFNEEYQNFYGDIKSTNYQNVLLDSIDKNVVQKGFEGVFFDTLDNIQHYIDEPFREELYLGYISFFKKVRSKYPNLSIIQNRAFDFYNFGSAEFLDGLMYEDLKYETLENSKYYNELIDELIDTSEKHNVIILALSHDNPLKNYQLAKELNWLYHFNPPDNNYMKLETTIYDIKIK